GLVAQRLQHRQIHTLTLTTPRHIFKTTAVFIAVTDSPPPPAASASPLPSPEDVRGMLAGVMDPELNASIVDLGMVEDVRVDDGVVTVKVALTTAGCPLRHQIKTDVQSKVD